jgi:hypothetical protein
MYKEHKSIVTPGKNTIVWRYMTYEKFEDILSKKAIYFRNVAKLEDPFEGSVPRKYINTRMSAHNTKNKMQYENLVIQGVIPNNYDLENFSVSKQFTKLYYINCWHSNVYESDAMWKLYSNDNKGVAVKSTVGSIIKSFSETDLDLYIGRVQYIDYDDMDVELSPNTVFELPFLKRKAFEHEREVRILASYLLWYNYQEVKSGLPEGANVWKQPEKGVEVMKDHGLYISCDPAKLIRSISIYPFTPKGYLEEIRNLCKKYGLKVDVRKSEMEKMPLF